MNLRPALVLLTCPLGVLGAAEATSDGGALAGNRHRVVITSDIGGPNKLTLLLLAALFAAWCPGFGAAENPRVFLLARISEGLPVYGMLGGA